MITALAGGLGLLTGLHAASWGAFKDAPFEGFRLASFLRSIVLGAAIALCTAVWLRPLSAGASVVLVGVVYAVERLATEWWKSIVRDDDQAAYTIPMRFGFRGRPVDDPRIRYAVGAAVVAAVLAALGVVHGAQVLASADPSWLVVLGVGGAGGWATACGGAWKDAPVEGFSGWKFLRSPVVATLWAVPLSFLTQSWVVLLLAAAGFAVASIETHKTFLSGGRPPGKFAGRAVSISMPSLRRGLAEQHAFLWLAIAVPFAARLAHAVTGPSITRLGTVPTLLPAAVLGSVAVAAVALALLVLRSSTQEPAPEQQR